MQTKDTAIEQFRELRSEIEKECARLHGIHKQYTSCKKGCSACCMNFGVLPVEFYTILDDIMKLTPKINKSANGDNCIFLDKGICSIYEFRPTICRSHGLPILDMDEEGDELQLFFCPLNFEDADDDYFTEGTSYQQDFYNSKAYLLNMRFLKEHPELGTDGPSLLELCKIADFI